MDRDSSRGTDTAQVGALTETHDKARWSCTWELAKFHGDRRAGDLPYEVIEGEGNILVTAGITLLLTLLTGGAGTAYSAANAHLGVGDAIAAAAIGQTDLQAATNKFRRPMEAGYPTVATNVLTLRSLFATTEANFAWSEWASFNALTAGTMLNRKVEALGTKTSASSWQLTVSITIS